MKLGEQVTILSFSRKDFRSWRKTGVVCIQVIQEPQLQEEEPRRRRNLPEL